MNQYKDLLNKVDARRAVGKPIKNVFIDVYEGFDTDFRAELPRLRKPRWANCERCGKKALDYSWGAPPKAIAVAWKGCTTTGHGGGSCATEDSVTLTQPLIDPKGRCCWIHKKPGSRPRASR